MKRQQQLTIEQHVEVARHCYAIREHLFAVLRITSGKIPIRLGSNFFDRIDRHLLRFRSKIEDILFAERPEEASIAIYFGATETACATTCKKEDAHAAKLFDRVKP